MLHLQSSMLRPAHRQLHHVQHLASHPRLFTSSVLRRALISEAIKKDHSELEQYYSHIVNGRSHDEQTRYRNQFVWELARHSIGEELVVYPEMEKNIQGGIDIANKDRKEHQKVKELLYKLQDEPVSSTSFRDLLDKLMNALRQHIKDEEQDDLPKLEQALSNSESRSLAQSFERTKMFVPTRSHPSAPDKPPYETVAGLMAAPIDKLKDMFRKFPGKAVSEEIPVEDENKPFKTKN